MGVNLDKVADQYDDSMDKAADSDNSLDQTIFYCSQAQGLLLLAVLQELHSIRKLLENRTA